MGKMNAPEENTSLTVRVIPCLDCKDGRVVKGTKFQDLQDEGDPVERSVLYEDQGADEIIILDVSATPEERGHRLETVRDVRRSLGIPLTAGGGVRSVEDVRELLEAGADRVSVNTAAVRRPAMITEMAQKFGRQCTVVAVDAARRDDGNEWSVVVSSGTENTGKSVRSWVQEVEDRGAGEILLTSWDRDGTGSGYDLDLLGAVTESVSIPVIASGGADDPRHMVEAIDAGAGAVLAASIFHRERYSVGDVKDVLSEHGVPVRPV